MSVTVAKANAELGVTGLKHAHGYVYLEENLPALVGDKALKTFAEMRDNDPVVASILAAIEMLARQTAVRIEAGGETPADEQAEQLVQSCLDDMSSSWDDTLSEMLSCLTFGFSYHEIVYKVRNGAATTEPGAGSQYSDGLVGWRKLPIRGQTTRLRWELDPKGGIQGMWQQPPLGGPVVFLPIRKCLLFRPKAHKNNPEGRSILRGAYRPWYFAKRLEEIEAIGIERNLAGYPVMRIPASIYADSTKLADWKAAVTRIKRDEQMGAVLPSDRDDKGEFLYDIQLLSPGSRLAPETDVIIRRYQTRIAQTMLADFIHLGQDSVGSFALAKGKVNLFLTAANTWLESIASVFNRHAIPRLIGLNGLAVDTTPRMTFAPLEQDDLLEWMQALQAGTSAGMPLFPDPAVENVIREKMGLPAMTEDEMTERETEDALNAQRQQDLEDERNAATAEMARARIDAMQQETGHVRARGQ